MCATHNVHAQVRLPAGLSIKFRCRAIQLFGWVVKALKHTSKAIYDNELNYYVAKWLINREPAWTQNGNRETILQHKSSNSL